MNNGRIRKKEERGTDPQKQSGLSCTIRSIIGAESHLRMAFSLARTMHGS